MKRRWVPSNGGDVVMIIDGELRTVTQEEAERRWAEMTPAERALRERIYAGFDQAAKAMLKELNEQ